MNKLIGIIFSIVLFLFLILTVINISDDYDKIIVRESFTAIHNVSIEEEFIVDHRVNEVLGVHVNSYCMDVEQIIISINLCGDGSIVFKDDATNINDLVEIEYNYVIESEEFVGSFIDVIPLIMIVILLGGIGFILIKGRN